MDRDFWAETNDPETKEWREDLTLEETAIIKEWDKKFLDGYTKLLRDIVGVTNYYHLACMFRKGFEGPSQKPMR